MTEKRFVELPGNTVARLPYIATNALMHAMAFDSPQHVLQRVCDRVLNAPAGGRLRFQIVAPYVLYTALYAERMYSGDPLDKSKGYVAESDIGFWIFVTGGDPDNPTSWEQFWLPVYLFVDRASALSAGREVFGYPKNLGEFVFSSASRDGDAAVEVKAEHYPVFGPGQPSEIASLFALEMAPTVAETEALQGIGDWSRGFADRFGLNRRPERARVIATQDPCAMLPMGYMPMIFLKQFRDLAQPARACYQAITTINAVMAECRDGNTLPGAYRLRLHRSDSHPIADDLGLSDGQGTTAVLPAAAQMRIDFNVGFGRVLAEL